MPAVFPSTVASAYTKLKNISGNAVSFGVSVTSLFDKIFGTSNAFGTAATKDTGADSGDIPLLGAGGRLASNRMAVGSTSQIGGVEIATNPETAAGNSTTKVVSVAGLESKLAGMTTTVAPATTSTAGVLELATNDEARSGASATLAVSPSSLDYAMTTKVLAATTSFYFPPSGDSTRSIFSNRRSPTLKWGDLYIFYRVSTTSALTQVYKYKRLTAVKSGVLYKLHDFSRGGSAYFRHQAPTALALGHAEIVFQSLRVTTERFTIYGVVQSRLLNSVFLGLMFSNSTYTKQP